MKLDYLENINEYGENIMRLCDFDKLQAQKFRDIMQQTIIINKKQLDLSSVDFITARNCNLILRIADADEGITSADNKIFYCDMTIKGYEEMISLLEPFCIKETTGYKWLYDIDNLTDFLFSPGDSW
ncbi:MAG: hypothetical protein H7Y00_08155 [Fimbriimonadaceae bacterium]|nr:hypothetical protein [Chitinophagales bacterium]